MHTAQVYIIEGKQVKVRLLSFLHIARECSSARCAFGCVVSLRAKTDRCSIGETAASAQSSNWVKSLWHPWQVSVTRAVPLSPQAHRLTYVSPALPRDLWETFRDPLFWCRSHSAFRTREEPFSYNWAPWHPGAHTRRLPFRDEDDYSFPIAAALLRVTGLDAECLSHSLCTASRLYPSHAGPPRHPTTTCVLCEMVMPPH